MSNTGENEQALRKILDMTRLISITLLILHFYYQLYNSFRAWHWTFALSDRILSNLVQTGLFNTFHLCKFFSLLFLAISVLGAKGRKSEKLSYKIALKYISSGLVIYFLTYFIFYLPAKAESIAVVYILVTGLGFLLILSGGTLLSRIIKDKLKDDIFNSDSETFPQEERLITNQYSVNLPAKYVYKGKVRKSWLNFLAVFRAILVCGSPGSGKTAFIIRHFITQILSKDKPFTALIYDFKFPDLSVIAYNYWLKNKHKYGCKSDCYFINFDDLNRTHRGNVFDPLGMTDITDASECARTLLLGLNRSWQKREGEFFVESPINFVTAIIWYLRRYKDGRYCTLPHVIELLMVDYDSLFSILQTEKTISVILSPFITAYVNDVMEQLEGQIASAKIALGRLASPQLYYVLSGNDFSLDINNPEHPKIICMGNNPQKILTYGAVLSLYINRMLKIINKKGKLPSMLVFDEFPTLTIDVLATISTGRSSLISVLLGVQDLTQLRKEYGREQADVIMATVGNIISGQVIGDTAKQLSERIGRIMQDRQSMSIGSDTSISRSKQLESAVPASKISTLSSGEFVGTLADLPDQKLPLKAFHSSIINDFAAINREEQNYKPIPVFRKVNQEMIDNNDLRIKKEVQEIVRSELERMSADPELEGLIIRK